MKTENWEQFTWNNLLGTIYLEQFTWNNLPGTILHGTIYLEVLHKPLGTIYLNTFLDLFTSKTESKRFRANTDAEDLDAHTEGSRAGFNRLRTLSSWTRTVENRLIEHMNMGNYCDQSALLHLLSKKEITPVETLNASWLRAIPKFTSWLYTSWIEQFIRLILSDFFYLWHLEEENIKISRLDRNISKNIQQTSRLSKITTMGWTTTRFNCCNYR